MSGLKELVEVGERLGLKGAELKQYVDEQKDKERLARREERDRETQRELQLKEKELQHAEKDKEIRLKQLELEQAEKDKEIRFKELELAEKDRDRAFKQIELENQVKLKELETTLAREKIQAELKTEGSLPGSRRASVGSATSNRSEDEADNHSGTRTGRGRLPKLPSFDEDKDEIDAYLLRFERYANQMGWPRESWSLYLSALLKGKALAVYSRLPTGEGEKYDVLKAELLRRFELTEEGFKRKFQTAVCEAGESPFQFVTRIKSYLDRWLTLAEVTRSVDGLIDFFVREQYLSTCSKELAMFLRERAARSLVALTTLAEQFIDAHGISTGTGVRGQRKDDAKSLGDSTGSGQQARPNVPSSPKRGGHSPSKKRCYICDKVGHIAKDCYRRVKTAGFVARGQFRPTAIWG